MSGKKTELDKVVIKFVGDSGDGMQLTGSQFTDTSALFGNDLATFPDFPAEIRAPQGTVAGVSGFQVHIGQTRIHNPGDNPDVLVCMNAAALLANLDVMEAGKTIILDKDSFKSRDYEKAGWEGNPLEDGTLENYNVVEAPITSLTREALKESALEKKNIVRCKNMFALGMVYFMFNRSMNHTEGFLDKKFIKKPILAEANKIALRAGFNFADTIQAISSTYSVAPAKMESGKYRNIMGNQATAWGFLAAAEKAGRKLFLGSYPITPASDILHELSRHKHLGCTTFQAEDEIASVCSAIGASYAGNLAITTTSGPGLALKAEAIGLAVSTELPIVIVDVQRGGPSTGLPTKTEQSDLLQAIHGRNGESPVAVVAASTPSNCFDYAYMASKIALEHMTPVLFLSDGYLGNGAGPWKIKTTAELPDINPPIVEEGTENWMPYERDERGVRGWAIPGTPGLEHRVGGLEKDSITGNVSYDPINHEKMTHLRAEKIEKIADFIPEQTVYGNSTGKLLVVGWGGTYGSLLDAVDSMLLEDADIGLCHFNYINPLPRNTEEIFSRFDTIIICELNMGQFAKYLGGILGQFKYEQYNKVQGRPFSIGELTEEFRKHL